MVCLEACKASLWLLLVLEAMVVLYSAEAVEEAGLPLASL